MRWARRKAQAGQQARRGGGKRAWSGAGRGVRATCVRTCARARPTRALAHAFCTRRAQHRTTRRARARARARTRTGAHLESARARLQVVPGEAEGHASSATRPRCPAPHVGGARGGEAAPQRRAAPRARVAPAREGTCWARTARRARGTGEGARRGALRVARGTFAGPARAAHRPRLAPRVPCRARGKGHNAPVPLRKGLGEQPQRLVGQRGAAHSHGARRSAPSAAAAHKLGWPREARREGHGRRAPRPRRAPTVPGRQALLCKNCL